MKTKTFTGRDSDGKEFEVIVKSPNPKQLADAKLHGQKAATKAIREQAISRSQIMDYLRKTGSWDDDKQTKLTELTHNIKEGERQLKRGGKTADGKKFTKVQAKELCLNMRRWRDEQISLLASQRELDQYTIEGSAENAQFDYLVSTCIFNNEGSRVFSSLEDYLAKATEPYAIQAAVELSVLIYGLDADFDKNRPENKFLVEHKFAREDLRLINEDGHLVDSDGRLINEEGRFIDKDGNLVDRSGNRVDEDGNPIEDFTPFEE